MLLCPINCSIICPLLCITRYTLLTKRWSMVFLCFLHSLHLSYSVSPLISFHAFVSTIWSNIDIIAAVFLDIRFCPSTDGTSSLGFGRVHFAYLFVSMSLFFFLQQLSYEKSVFFRFVSSHCKAFLLQASCTNPQIPVLFLPLSLSIMVYSFLVSKLLWSICSWT